MNVAVNLYEYLKENDSAELVGLGTFYVSTQSARISSLTGEIRPPCRKLTFKAEENNDMNFVINMADKEFISHETALVWVKQYAESLKEKIQSGKKIQIGELGTLSKDYLDNYVFEASEKLSLMDNSFAFAPLKDVKTFDNNDETIELIRTIDPENKVEEVVEESVPQVEEEPVVIQLKPEETIQSIVEEPIKEIVEHTEAVVFSENEELKQEGEIKEELQVETQAEATEVKEIEKEVEIEDIKPADEDLRERAQAIIEASKREKEEKEEEEKNKKKDKKKKKAKKRKKRILLTILFILLFLILACGGLVAAHYFGLLKNYKFMNPISEKLSYYIKPKAQEPVIVVVETPTETIVEEEFEVTESSTETILEEVQANPIPAPKPIKNNTTVTTKKTTTKQEKKEETPQQPAETVVDNSPVVVQNYSKLGCDVVCGSFKDKAQAEKKARKAKSLGYDSYIINRVQGGEQVYYVSYGSRRSLDEANKLAVKIKEKIGGDFYVISR
ncbi:MAG: SPOR domain-containing protein [Bacteroidales bacterium]|nr:SPOR domain-containing protein [Bacteroidales bacterium]